YSTHRQSPCSAGSIRTRKKPSVLVSIDIDSEPPVGVTEGDDAQRHRQIVEQRFAARIQYQLAELVGVIAAGAQQARENLRSDGDRRLAEHGGGGRDHGGRSRLSKISDVIRERLRRSGDVAAQQEHEWRRCAFGANVVARQPKRRQEVAADLETDVLLPA